MTSPGSTPEEWLDRKQPPAFYHLTNLRTPFDTSAQQCLTALGTDYRISLPIEAEPALGIIPVPQAVMIQNGIVGLYITLAAVQRPEMAPHTPGGPVPVTQWLPLRPTLAAAKPAATPDHILEKMIEAIPAVMAGQTKLVPQQS